MARRTTACLAAAAVLALPGCAPAAPAPVAHTAAQVASTPAAAAQSLLAEHGLTGMAAAEVVDHLVVDGATGEVLLAGPRTTFDNGFRGLRLPRGTSGTVRVAAGDRSGEAAFSTAPDAATCLTTLRLA